MDACDIILLNLKHLRILSHRVRAYRAVDAIQQAYSANGVLFSSLRCYAHMPALCNPKDFGRLPG